VYVRRILRKEEIQRGIKTLFWKTRTKPKPEHFFKFDLTSKNSQKTFYFEQIGLQSHNMAQLFMIAIVFLLFSKCCNSTPVVRARENIPDVPEHVTEDLCALHPELGVPGKVRK